MDYIILTILAFAVGWKAGCVWMVALFKQVLQELGIKPEQLEKLMIDHVENPKTNSSESSIDEERDYPTVAIKVEKHGEVLYAFDKTTDEFLGQGDTKESLIERLGTKFSNVTLTIAEDDGAEFVDGRYRFDIATKEIKQVDN